MSGGRRAIAAGLSATAALLAPVPVSAVAQDEPDRVELIARELRRDPVYVSDALVREVSPDEVTELRREVRRMPVPTYLVLVPRIVPLGPDRLLEPGDEWPALLRDALGRDGVYLVGGDSGSLDAGTFGVRTAVRAFDATIWSTFDLPRSRRLPERVTYALGLLRGEPRLPRDERDTILESEGGPRYDPAAQPRQDAEGSAWWLVGGVVGLPVFAVATYRELRARGTRGRHGGPGDAPSAATRRHAEKAVERLSVALAAATDPPDRAFALREAAGMALDRRRDGDLDDLGALVLAEQGLELLDTGGVRPRCFYDPRHGPARGDTRWTQGGRTVAVPACRACARRVRGRRAPASLVHDGRPYWERRSVWARTGFGTLDPDVRRALTQERR